MCPAKQTQSLHKTLKRLEASFHGKATAIKWHVMSTGLDSAIQSCFVAICFTKILVSLFQCVDTDWCPPWWSQALAVSCDDCAEMSMPERSQLVRNGWRHGIIALIRLVVLSKSTGSPCVTREVKVGDAIHHIFENRRFRSRKNVHHERCQVPQELLCLQKERWRTTALRENPIWIVQCD